MSESAAMTIESPGVVRARRAIEGDVPGVSQALAAAFFDDPVVSWIYADPAARREIGPRFFRIVTEAYLGHGGVYTTDDHVAGAVWVPPEVEDDERMAVALGEISGEYARTLFEVLEVMGEQHPREPHHYLFLLGTRPEWQSRGIGSALMRPVLETCDRDAVPAYLEATSEHNRSLYLRHGFEVTGEIRLPGSGPSMWPMWRAPR